MKQEKISGTPTEVDDETAAAAASAVGESKTDKRRWLRPLLLFIVPALLLLGGAYYWFSSGGSVSTDNAAVKQDIVSVSPQVAGPVVEVKVRNGDHVKRGDLLFRIDPASFRVALEQAEAQLAAAKLQTTQLRTQAVGTGAEWSSNSLQYVHARLQRRIGMRCARTGRYCDFKEVTSSRAC